MEPRRSPLDNPEEWIEEAIAELAAEEPSPPEEETAAPQSGASATAATGMAAEAAQPAKSPSPDPVSNEDREEVSRASRERENEEAVPLPRPEESRTDHLRSMALPKGLYAHFLLVDIDAPVRETRGIPRYLPVDTCSAWIGRKAGVRIFLDDAKTVAPIHAKIEYNPDAQSDFVLTPHGGSRVLVNGKPAPAQGVVCQNGDWVQIGSARLIFFSKNLREAVVS